MQQKRLKKILFDARSCATTSPTGVGYYTKGVIEALAQNYPDIQFVGHYFLQYGGSDNGFALPRAKNITYKKSRILPEKLINLFRRYKLAIPFELLAKTRADIIFYPAYLGLPSIFRTPVVTSIHDLSYITNPDTVSTRNRNDLIKLVPKSIKRSYIILTISEHTKQQIVSNYKLDESRILVHGIPPREGVLINNDELAITIKQLGIKRKYILFTGTLEPRKNIAWLIRAFLALSEKKRKDYQLVLAGGYGWKSDEIHDEVDKVVRQSDDVVAVGYVDERTRQALLQSCEALVMASLEEGFGMPILEAAQYQKPALLSDIDVFHEVAGRGAEYFDHTSAQSFEKAFQSLLLDPEKLKNTGASAAKNLSRYNWTDVSKKIMECFYSLI